METPEDIVYSRLQQVRSMMLVAMGDMESFGDATNKTQDFYFYTMFTLLEEAIEARKEL